jgi:hypothetical protein
LCANPRRWRKGQGNPGRAFALYKEGRGPGRSPLLPLTLFATLSPSSFLRWLGEALQDFSSTTTTPSCCWDSEGIYYIRCPLERGEDVYIDSTRVTEYGSAARSQNFFDKHEMISLTLWIFEG